LLIDLAQCHTISSLRASSGTIASIFGCRSTTRFKNKPHLHSFKNKAQIKIFFCEARGPENSSTAMEWTKRLLPLDCGWPCPICTYDNNPLLFLVCAERGTPKASQDDEVPDVVKHVPLSPAVLKRFFLI
jgi:hypothetical protein